MDRRGDDSNQSRKVDGSGGNDMREAKGRREGKGGGQQPGRLQVLLFFGDHEQ